MAEPAPGFLEGLRTLADRDGFVLVFDEMITGMRWSAGRRAGGLRRHARPVHLGQGARQRLPVSALAGRRELMELGGLRTDAARVFLLSTTHGPETTGLAAYLAVAEAYRRAGRRRARWSGRAASSPTAVERGGGRARARPSTSRSSAGPPAWCS